MCYFNHIFYQRGLFRFRALYNIKSNSYFYSVASVHIVASVVKIVSYCLTLGLYYYQLRQGVVTSGVLFVFWFFEAIFGAVTFRTLLMTDLVTGPNRILPLTNYVIQYPIVASMFFLNFFADPKPKFVNLDGKL